MIMMIKLSWSFFFYGFLIFFLASADTFEAPVFNGYQIATLVQTTAQNRFNFEAETWSTSGLLRSTKASLCAGFCILGGPNALENGGYFMNQFDDLPGHDIIYYYLRFFLVGSWTSTDIISLLFDSKEIDIGNIDLLTSELTTETCDGATWSLRSWYTIVGKIYHTGPSLTLKIISDLTTSPALANFGIRDVYMIFANKTASDTEAYCFKMAGFILPEAIPNKCPCPEYAYPNPSNPAQCLACDASCFECFGPSSSECFVCNGGYSFVESQCIQCDTSCKQCSGPGANQCVTCANGLWLYWNNTCLSTCTSPLTSQLTYDNLWICNLPCPEGQYMLWNGTCVGSCDDPLKIVVNSTGNFCDKPCLDGEFFYANRSCLSPCDLPFVASVTLYGDTCDWKCDSGQYMRWDYTCWDTCDSPLEVTTNSTGKFCWKPCQNGEFLYSKNGSCIAGPCGFPFEQGLALGVVDTCFFKCSSGEFLYENDGSCVSSCGFPFLSRDGVGAEGKFCYSPCASGEYILANRSCSANCSFSGYYSEKVDDYTQLCLESKNEDYSEVRTIVKVIKTEGQISYGLMLALSIGKMGSSSSLCLASLAKMLEYIKYMRIDYSQRLDLMFQLQGSSELSVSFSVPLSEGIQEKFPDHELPWNFEEYELGSSFFLNYWETLGSLLVILGGALVLTLLTMITKGKNYHHVFVWLKTVFKWNFVLMIFCSNFEGVVFFTSLEMRTLNVDSFAAFLSLFVCVVANICAVAILGRITFILKDIRKLKYRQVRDISRGPGEKTNPHRKWRNYQVLFLHCHEEKPIQQGFFIIFLVRVYFFHLTIGYIFPEPLAQSVIITLLSVLMLAYYIIQRPLEEKNDLIKLIINESIVLVVNFSALVLAALGQDGKPTQRNTELFSYIIIMANLLFNTLAMIFLGIESVVALSKIYKEIKEHKLKGINSLLEIFMMMFAGEAMAMEEEYLSPDVDAEATTVTPEKQQKPKENELETPQYNDEKIINVTTAELLKLQSPQSPSSPRSVRSLVGEEEEGISVLSRTNMMKQQGRKPSETVFKFDNTGLKELEGSQKKPSIFMRSENASMVLLSPPGVGDEKESSIKYESEAESKATPAKVDMNNENEKLLFMNWPEGNVVNLDD